MYEHIYDVLAMLAGIQGKNDKVALKVLSTFEHNEKEIKVDGEEGRPGRNSRTPYVRGSSLSQDKIVSKSIDLLDTIITINNKDSLYSNIENGVIRVLRRGISLYYTMIEMYEESSGLKLLKTFWSAEKSLISPSTWWIIFLQRGKLLDRFC